MANSGPHTNASQFFLTLAPLPSFDTKFVAFGVVVEGEEVLKALEAIEVVCFELYIFACASLSLFAVHIVCALVSLFTCELTYMRP